MLKEITIKELCEKLWKLEKEWDLVTREINGIRFWELIRFEIFNILSRKLLNYGQAHTEKNKLKDKLVNIFELTKNSLTKNPFSGNYLVDFLLYDHPRKIQVDGKHIDIYTQDFIESKRGEMFNIIERPHLWKHKHNFSSKERKYTDHELLTNFIKKKLFPIRLNEKDLSFIKELNNELNLRFNIDINIYSVVLRSLQSFIFKKEYHKRLFIKRKPKKIYVVVSYSIMPIIAAAKELGIKVIEFQHGVITDYHFAYNYSDPKLELRYFPDKLLTFGEYWGKTKGFPKQTEIEVYGFPYLNQQLRKYKNIKKNKNQILILSQGTIGNKLSKLAEEVAKNMPDHYFVYKLHPGEYDRWRKEYPSLVRASKLSNFEVVDNNNKNLYNYFAESEFQIGVYSTAIFEGLTLNCKTILFNLPGIEYMEDLINQNIVQVADNSDEVINFIINFQPLDFSRDYFFKE